MKEQGDEQKRPYKVYIISHIVAFQSGAAPRDCCLLLLKLDSDSEAEQQSSSRCLLLRFVVVPRREEEAAERWYYYNGCLCSSSLESKVQLTVPSFFFFFFLATTRPSNRSSCWPPSRTKCRRVVEAHNSTTLHSTTLCTTCIPILGPCLCITIHFNLGVRRKCPDQDSGTREFLAFGRLSDGLYKCVVGAAAQSQKKGEKAAARASLKAASAFEGCCAMPFIVRPEAVPWS